MIKFLLKTFITDIGINIMFDNIKLNINNINPFNIIGHKIRVYIFDSKRLLVKVEGQLISAEVDDTEELSKNELPSIVFEFVNATFFYESKKKIKFKIAIVISSRYRIELIK